MHEVDQDVVVMYTLVTIFLFKFVFQKLLSLFVYYVHEGYEGVCRVFTMIVYVGIYFEGVCRVFTLRMYVGYLL